MYSCIERVTNIRWFCATLVTTAMLSGSALAGSVVLGDGTYRVPVVSWKEARYSRVITQQYDFSCGSAAVATLLTFGYDHPTDEQMAFRQMYAHGDQATIQKVGFSLLDMRQYLVEQGYDAEGFRADLDTVIRIGVPAITLITTGIYRHFVVLR
jgi:predicted double-glycine peptidase